MRKDKGKNRGVEQQAIVFKISIDGSHDLKKQEKSVEKK